MTTPSVNHPSNAQEVRDVIAARLDAASKSPGVSETVTIEWRATKLTIPVISMPVELLSYNPDTHRIRAQRSLDPQREAALNEQPFGSVAQDYLHDLLRGDPTNPSQIDPSFEALKEDLKKHGQSEPGIVTRTGVLINGNTRRAALKELGWGDIRVAVLPPDAGFDDIQSVELSLQLRKDHKRDYSFMNFLLAIDERVQAGKLATVIQSDFRIQPATFERARWILALVRDAIERSKASPAGACNAPGLRYSDFEEHQGKLEELYRAYVSLKRDSPDLADALREQRLLALVLEKSKTDLRLIDPDFINKYAAQHVTGNQGAMPSIRKIPGTTINAPGPSQNVQALKDLTTRVLQAKAVRAAAAAANAEDLAEANKLLQQLTVDVDNALGKAGKQVRLQKRQLVAAERITDASDSLALATDAVAGARASNSFDPEELDEPLIALRAALEKLAMLLLRDNDSKADGVTWLRAVITPPDNAK